MTAEKKTVCFFNSNRAWGGGEKWHLTTCKELGLRGHDTFLVTNIRSELYTRATQHKLKTYSLHVHNLSFLNPFKLLTLVRLFKAHKIDAIILNLPSDLKLAGIAAKIAGVKKIIYRRGMPHPLRNTWLNRFLFKKILTQVVVNSEEIARNLKQSNEAWFPNDKLALIFNGVETNSRPKMTKKLYEKVGQEIVIGNAGRLTEQKGQKYLIELATLLKNESVPFKLLVAGEGELKEKLLELIEKNNLKTEVILLGHVSEMNAFFQSLDLFVFTSLYEGSANTLIETLHHGIPTIAFDISSNPEIIENEKTGLLVKPFEIVELKNQVLRLSSSSELQEKLIQGGYNFIQSKFDSKLNLTKLENLI
jgi:glycosyltransferase involved in cell wall biosynthesis